ncbi:MAG: hypothetical protein ICV60_21005 [Pyrinomonadaceae bacterium]|nr:hypothetical protein [Pyrinomonadaceae bacterium]
MHTFVPKRDSILLVLVIFSLAISQACQTATNTNTTTTTTNTNAGANTNTTTTTTTTTGTAPDTREPEKYRATINLKIEATGNQTATLPTLTAEFARDGANRRLSFVLPGNEEVVYVDQQDKRIIILPKRKQYAELTPEATGFEVPSVMTPAQIVNQLKSSTNYQLVGDEIWNGRPATKYRFASTQQTNTQAGEVKTEAYLYVDKETGLPLRSETMSQSTSGNVQGYSGAKMIQEITNIQMDVDPKLFQVPEGFAKVEPQQIRQQVNAVAQAALFLVQQVMQNAQRQQPAANTNAAPAANTSPAATPAR